MIGRRLLSEFVNSCFEDNSKPKEMCMTMKMVVKLPLLKYLISVITTRFKEKVIERNNNKILETDVLYPKRSLGYSESFLLYIVQSFFHIV